MCVKVPDKVFDHADQVEVIDIEPEELIERIEGKFYAPSQAERALGNFFRREKLVALQKLHCEELLTESIISRKKNAMRWGDRTISTGEHVLVCISSSPSNTKVIRTVCTFLLHSMLNLPGFIVETSQMQEAD